MQCLAMPALVAALFCAQSAEAETSSGLHGLITQKAQAHSVPVAFAHAVTRVESSYNCGAVGAAGEVGPMQIKPATARGVGVSVNRGSDCSTKVEASMRYLKQAIDRHGGGCAAATAYNQGIHAPSRCSSYGRKVLAAMKRG